MEDCLQRMKTIYIVVETTRKIMYICLQVAFTKLPRVGLHLPDMNKKLSSHLDEVDWFIFYIYIQFSAINFIEVYECIALNLIAVISSFNISK